MGVLQNGWFIIIGKSHLEMDDLEVRPFMETSISLSGNIEHFVGPPTMRQLWSERFLPLRPSLAHPSTVDLPPAFAPRACGDGLF